MNNEEMIRDLMICYGMSRPVAMEKLKLDKWRDKEKANREIREMWKKRWKNEKKRWKDKND